MAFQNTKFRIKDKSTANASSSLLKGDVIIRDNATTGIIRSGEFTINATTGLGVNTTFLQAEALFAKVTAGLAVNSIAGTVVAGTLQAAHVEVNVSNSVASGAGIAGLANTTYGLVVDFTSDTDTRQVPPTAFLAFGEKQGTIVGSTAKQNGVSYLFDLGYAVGGSNTFYVNATQTTGVANGAFRNANCTGANAGCFAVRVNGVEKFIPLYGTVA